ncbi:MAG: hypothetical protein WCQ82_02890 [Bacteroidaceae bacterium]|nr:hypothetical protein [Bacteroidaceae bacterium]
MIQALFYKEWIKTRWFLLVALLTIIGVTGYCILRVYRAGELNGMDHLWLVMLTRGVTFVELLQYLPLAIGGLLALVQFVPEMQKSCLKLTLHLPHSALATTYSMLLWGTLFLTLCFCISSGLLYGYLHTVFTTELWQQSLFTTFPWFLAGYMAYFLTSAICLEPTWKRRIGYCMMSLVLLHLFFLNHTAQAYNPLLPFLILLTLLTATFPWLSVLRFKAGCQD